MGNFSVGHYTCFRIQDHAVEIHYRLDLAEIPTVEELRKIETDAEGHITEEGKRAYLTTQMAKLSAGQHWKIDGNSIVPTIKTSDLQERAGAGNLPTLLITIDYQISIAADVTRLTLDYEDSNYPARTGWREIVALSGGGGKISESNVPASDRSNALDAYPADLTSPPNVRRAHVVFELIAPDGPVNLPATKPAESNGAESNAVTPRDRFTALISARALSVTLVISSLLIAFVLGSFHALSPGHGKTVVAAYLVGSRGTPRHALLLGIVVTVTHVAGVFALGFIVLLASRFIIPERVYPWLGFTSGLLIASIGLWQITRRYAAAFARQSISHFHDGHYHLHASDGQLHDHENRHEHHHGPGGHSHDMPEKITPASLIALGVSGGIVPCPSALVVLLAAIALHRTAFGMVLIVSFSFGLASVLIAIGLMMLQARRYLERLELPQGWLQRLPLGSSILVTLLGLSIAIEALWRGGVFSGGV